MRSESIAALSAALSKAQGTIVGAAKDTENPYFKSRYADLSSVWDACRSQLSANGLAVIQLAGSTDDGISVETILSHSSGEWIAEVLSVPLDKRTAQSMGSAITYARRYALAAIVGVAPMDDDGHEATEAVEWTGKKKQAQPSNGSATISPAQHQELSKALGSFALEEINLPAFLDAYKIKAIGDLPAVHFLDAMAKLKAKRKSIDAKKARAAAQEPEPLPDVPPFLASWQKRLEADPNVEQLNEMAGEIARMPDGEEKRQAWSLVKDWTWKAGLDYDRTTRGFVAVQQAVES